MSVLDELHDAERRVAERLKELEPAVSEYRELELVAQRLGIDVSATHAPKPTRRRRRSRKPVAATKTAARGPSSAGDPTNAAAKRAGADNATASVTHRSTDTAGGTKTAARTPSRRNARPGQRSEQLVALVKANPGITVREAAGELGVDPTSLYRVVRRLEESGALRKTGLKLEAVRPAT